MRKSIAQFCKKIGNNALLTQGAGGNVSWKENGVLWIKGSGTWLEDAMDTDIFVPVDLSHCTKSLLDKNFDVIPKVVTDSKLKPSIETLLHAIMPNRVVVHLHAVGALAYLVTNNAEKAISSALANIDIKYLFVPYFQPGASLANEVFENFQGNESVNLIFLQNHGIVIGADDVNEVERVLMILDKALVSNNGLLIKKFDKCVPQNFPVNYFEGYVPVPEPDLHMLAINHVLFDFVKNCWALYPDHVVFLGAKSYCYDDLVNISSNLSEIKIYNPPCIFVYGLGTFVKIGFSSAQMAQLRCYYDVIQRVPNIYDVKTLSTAEVYQLLNWGAEKHRINVSK